MCEFVRDSRLWDAHSGGSGIGARHCNINIPSLSTVNQRGIRRSSPTPLIDLRPWFRVTSWKSPGRKLLTTALFARTSHAPYFHIYRKKSSRTTDKGNFLTVDEEVYTIWHKIICALSYRCSFDRIRKNCFRIASEGVSTKDKLEALALPYVSLTALERPARLRRLRVASGISKEWKIKKKAKSLSTERLPCTLSPTARLNKKYDEKHRARLGSGCFMDRGNFSPRCASSTVVPRRLYHGEIVHPLPSFSSTYFCDVNTTRKAPRDLYTSVSHLVEAESGLSLSMGRSNFLLKASPSKWLPIGLSSHRDGKL